MEDPPLVHFVHRRFDQVEHLHLGPLRHCIERKSQLPKARQTFQQSLDIPKRVRLDMLLRRRLAICALLVFIDCFVHRLVEERGVERPKGEGGEVALEFGRGVGVEGDGGELGVVPEVDVRHYAGR